MMGWTFKINHYDGGMKDWTARIGTVSWSESVDQLGSEFTFTVPFSKWDDRFDGHTIKCGDIFIIYKGKTIWNVGIITETPINGSEYKGYDFAWYLNQSETIMQFKKIRADKAIEQICNKFGVPIGALPKMATTIKKVYKDVSPAEIIKDILDKVENETDKNLYVEMYKGQLCVRVADAKNSHIKPTFKDELGRTIPCTNSAEIEGTKSIEELRNYVVYANSGDKKKGIKGIAKSEKSINRYGMLSVVETKDKLTSAKARQYAKNKLKKLNKVTVTFNVRMRGAIGIKPHRRIYFEKTGYNIKGWYKVKSVTHTIDNGMHIVEMEMSNK